MFFADIIAISVMILKNDVKWYKCNNCLLYTSDAADE